MFRGTYRLREYAQFRAILIFIRERGQKMKFSVHINNDTAACIKIMGKTLHRSRNSIVQEALDEWIKVHTSEQWPNEFDSIQDLPDFKNPRKDLHIPETPVV